MGGKVFNFVLVGIVALLTLALAMLAGYVFILNPSQGKQAELQQSEQTKEKRPLDAEIASEALSEEKVYYNLKSTDPQQIAVIELEVELVYYKKVSNIKDVLAKITLYKTEIKELISTYFANLTLDDVKLSEVKEKAKVDLTKNINELLNKSEKEKNDIIYTIVFGKWFYQ